MMTPASPRRHRPGRESLGRGHRVGDDDGRARDHHEQKWQPGRQPAWPRRPRPNGPPPPRHRAAPAGLASEPERLRHPHIVDVVESLAASPAPPPPHPTRAVSGASGVSPGGLTRATRRLKVGLARVGGALRLGGRTSGGHPQPDQLCREWRPTSLRSAATLFFELGAVPLCLGGDLVGVLLGVSR